MQGLKAFRANERRDQSGIVWGKRFPEQYESDRHNRKRVRCWCIVERHLGRLTFTFRAFVRRIKCEK